MGLRLQERAQEEKRRMSRPRGNQPSQDRCSKQTWASCMERKGLGCLRAERGTYRPWVQGPTRPQAAACGKPDLGEEAEG